MPGNLIRRGGFPKLGASFFWGGSLGFRIVTLYVAGGRGILALEVTDMKYKDSPQQISSDPEYSDQNGFWHPNS